MDDLERRIRDRAYQLWLDDGCPEGRSAEHWEMARELVAQEDNQALMTAPNPAAGGTDEAIHPEPVEPLEAVENQGEFPDLADQGEKPSMPQPRRRARRA